jgi:hypothetical protein
MEVIEKKRDGGLLFCKRVKRSAQVIENKGAKISLIARGEEKTEEVRSPQRAQAASRCWKCQERPTHFRQGRLLCG